MNPILKFFQQRLRDQHGKCRLCGRTPDSYHTAFCFYSLIVGYVDFWDRLRDEQRWHLYRRGSIPQGNPNVIGGGR